VKIFLHTFGCKANQYDTELLRARMERAGGVSVEDSRHADLCLVNSCSVTAAADKECRQFVRRLLRDNPRARVVVTGCYATHSPEELRSLSPKVEVYSNKEKDNLPACVGFELKPEVFGLSRYPTRARAFVKIQDGCRAPCRYCIIPTVRSEAWSKPVGHVLKEVETLAREGHGEIVLTGIRLGLYKGELGGKKGTLGLVGLLKELVRLPGEFRLRLSSLEVTEVSDDLLKLAASTEKICRHFHVPLQSGDDKVLKDMGRWYKYSVFEERVRRIRERLPDAAVTSDVLVGYPTETDAAFRNTLERVEELRLSGLHVFRYSSRPGTPAAELKPLPPAVLRARAAQLLALADRLRGEFRRRFVGTTRRALAEPSGAGWTDNYLRVSLPPGSPVGRLVPVRVGSEEPSGVSDENP